MACEREQERVQSLKDALADARDDCAAGLRGACAKIAPLTRQLAVAQAALDDCRAHVSPPPPPTTAPPPPPPTTTPPPPPPPATPEEKCARVRDLLTPQIRDLEARIAELRAEMDGASGGLLHSLAAQVADAQRELASKRLGLCKRILIHFKSLVPVTPEISAYFTAQFNSLRDLYATGGVIASLGTMEDLSGDANVQTLRNLNVEGCIHGRPTDDQKALFEHRRGADRYDIVVYFVASLIGTESNVAGCATHPDDKPGAAVLLASIDWIVAHEVGHVLGLKHVDRTVPSNSDFLMWPDASWTNLPPDISLSEFNTMKASPLTHEF